MKAFLFLCQLFVSYIYNLLTIHAPITIMIIASAIALFIFSPFYFLFFWNSYLLATIS
nr:MAG TPA: hypothetical protein [Caudoviricetes sp.]